MTKDELEDFIERNHRILTLSELIEFSGESQSRIYRIITKKGFKVISIAERTICYINSHSHLSFNQLLEKLELTDASFQVYIKKMGFPRIKPKDYDKPLNQVITLNKPEKKEITKNIDNPFEKYQNTITWEQLTGNDRPVWGSF